MCLLLALLGLADAAPAAPSTNPFLKQEAERLYAAVSDAVTASGGDLNTQHVHLAFAFSTGHFARDPGMAEAARIVASDLAERHLVAGDQISAYAWEQSLWPHAGERLNPFKVSEDRTALRSSFQNLWPRTAQAGSEGGHDTEAVITELADRLDGQADTVMILLTNTAASATGRSGERTVGENSPAYLSALERWTRMRTSNTTGASVQLKVSGEEGARQFDAVILTPQQFQGAALPTSRAELIKQQLAGPVPPRRSFPWWIAAVIIGGLGMAGLAWWFRGGAAPRSAARMVLHAGGRSFPLHATGDGETICVICGPGYPVPPTSGHHVVLGPGVPPIKLLSVTREAGGLKLIPDLDVTLEGVDTPFIPLQRDAEYPLTLRGRAATQPNLPAKPYQTSLTLAVHPEEY